MSDQVTIKCKHCSKNFDWTRLRLAQHWGETVELKCKICKQPNRVKVDADLMSGKTPVSVGTEPATEYTMHINPDDKSFQIAKLNVLTNEYHQAQSFVLQEGEYIIGRQCDDDIGIPNKIRIVTEDTKISRSHCQITVLRKHDQSCRYIITDLGSLNGTHIQTALGTKKLENNDKIVVHLGDLVDLGYRSQIKLEI